MCLKSCARRGAPSRRAGERGLYERERASAICGSRGRIRWNRQRTLRRANSFTLYHGKRIVRNYRWEREKFAGVSGSASKSFERDSQSLSNPGRHHYIKILECSRAVLTATRRSFTSSYEIPIILYFITFRLTTRISLRVPDEDGCRLLRQVPADSVLLLPYRSSFCSAPPANRDKMRNFPPGCKIRITYAPYIQQRFTR